MKWTIPAPGWRRGVVGIGLSLVMVTAVQAAAPWTPAQLPAEIRGVRGSGDKLSLQIRADGADRVVKPGEVYRDGWTLQALTPSEATLSRDGSVVRVGLNPTGALASSAPVARSEVVVQLSEEERDILAQAMGSGAWNGEAWPGLTLEQTQRVTINNTRLTAAYKAKSAASNNGDGIRSGLTADEIRAVIGQGAFEQQVALSSLLISQGQRQLPFTQPLMGIGFSVVSDGVQVNFIDPGSSSDQAGLRPGDFIVKVNGEDAVTQTNRRMAGDEVLSLNPLVYTLSTGRVITVQPTNYLP